MAKEEQMKKKVALISISDNTNFGTYLQILATGLSVKSLGYDVEVIRYIRPFMTPKGYFAGVCKEVGWLRATIRRIRNNPSGMFKLRDKDYEFLGQYLTLTKEYQSYAELKHCPPVADLYLTGSDQVWNSYYNHGVDRSFFLGFAPENKPKIAYASSIGMEDFPSEEIQETVDLLNNYDRITVRESSAKDILSKYGINSEVVLDPTLLLDQSQWTRIAQDFPMEIAEDYLLVYSVETRNEASILESLAEKIAKEKNLKIYYVGYSSRALSFKIADKYFNSATPEVFLSLMLKASFVLVSSFHGTAFSINFNKQFLTVQPKRFSSRVNSLLKALGLENRAIKCKEDVDGIKDIDYGRVNKVLASERLKSRNILTDLLKLCKSNQDNHNI